MCRGALLFNHYIVKNKLDMQSILSFKNGEKIKFLLFEKTKHHS